MSQEVEHQLNRLAVMNELARSFQRETPSLSSLLTGILSAGQELTGAKYAALGVYDEAGERLVQFLTVGLDDAARTAIGSLPTGRGLLGHLAKEAGVLRLRDLRCHPASMGFPPHHPPMTSFMGASLRAHGKLFGRLYLTDKVGPGGVVAEFTDLDEQTITALAYQASSAIETAHLFEQVRQSESRLRAILDSVQEGIYGIDLDGRCLFMNKAGAALLGYGADELVGRSMHQAIHHSRENGTAYPIENCPIHSASRTVQAVRSENEGLWKRDGTALAVICQTMPLRDGAGALLGAVISFADISERKRLEEQLRQSQKMEAVGRLAGGIAHDFNNLLTAVLGYSSLLVQSLDPSDARHADARTIQKAGERATALTRQLLAISRRQVLEPKVLDLNALVANLDQMLRRLIREDIVLLTVLDPALGRVRADQSQIEQVMMNLALNARDAMPEGGRLTIETADVELDEVYCRTHAEVSPGPHVMLAVSDTGVGMDAATLARCFEPFFTTKPVGQGTGLGLATVYGIVKQSGGSIWVYSEPGHGTTFKVYLPRVAGDVSAVEIPTRPVQSEHPAVTILLVEDDEAVRQFARRSLAAAGHIVLEAADGEEALRVSRRHEGEIHLLITDVVMPGMSGRLLAERLSVERPGLKVLYISGYAENAIVHNGILDAGTAFLHKPLTADVLLGKVRDVLDTRGDC
jgi:PAS domain S-box-containing protein